MLAECTVGSGARLEIQRALTFDDQDKALDMDTYSLCTEDGKTHYGGVPS
ncbi:Imm10 family immunity protein [Pendulispora rubella]